MNNEEKVEYRGSQKHILDWISREDFVDSFNEMMADSGIKIKNKETLKPENSDKPEEFNLASYSSKYSQEYNFLEKGIELAQWWAPKGGKLPTWDLISVCEIKCKPGLLLVEAKAHVDEFDWKGKRLSENASEGSKDNHTKISLCLQEAHEELKEFKVSIDSHYQLSNRIASAWKLSKLGIPVVLLYLGFTADTYFSNDFFKDSEHWKNEFNNYIRGIVPETFINNTESSPFLFYERSLKIKEISKRRVKRLYADEEYLDFTYENVSCNCPRCNAKNIYNRVSDLKTLEQLDFVTVKCSHCEIKFNIEGDTINDTYELILMEVHEAKRKKEYRNCILLLTQALETFLNQTIENAVLNERILIKGCKSIGEYNGIKKKYFDKLEKLTFTPMKILFYDIFLNKRKFKSKEEIENFIDEIMPGKLRNLTEELNQKIQTDIKNFPDKSISEMFNILNKTRLHEIRNKVIHKFVYRPSLQEVEECFKDVENITQRFNYTLGKWVGLIKPWDNNVSGC
jgi:hypothetical protein